MINIFFVPGMFGSTIEHVLRNYTKEMIPTGAKIAKDGSMHTFKKQNHIFERQLLAKENLQDINTPIYPFKDLHFPELLENYSMTDSAKNILIYAERFEDAELNLIFQYHKLVIGLNHGFDIFCSDHKNMLETVRQWNPGYKSYKDMQHWEFREWFSLFYPTWIQEWQDSQHQVSVNWLKISSRNILTDTLLTFKTIINFCKLTEIPGLDNFVVEWKNAQQYIVNEYKLLSNIVDHTLTQTMFNWSPINLVSEAIIQQKLRQKGFELKCDGLNTFPTNSIDLYNLLDNSLKLHHTQGQT